MTKAIFLQLLILVLLQPLVKAQGTITINIDVANGTLVINSTSFGLNSTREEYEKVLGKPERIEKVIDKDKILAYDKAGISLALQTGTNKVQEVYITYIADDDKKAATGTFKGNLEMNGKPVTTQTTAKEIEKLVAQKMETSMPSLFTCKNKGMILLLYYPEKTMGQLGVSFTSDN